MADAARQLARQLERPWLVTVHATEYGRHQGWVQHHPQSYIHAAEREMVRGADAVITCSRFMRIHVASIFGIPPAGSSRSPTAIDPQDLEPVTGDLPALRARFASPDERLVLLVGRLVYEKGFHLALEGLAPVAKRLGNVRFVVAGTGTAEAELKRQARRLGLTHRGSFLGWVGDDMLHSLYRVAEIVIVPSIYEPFGLVALEAMASGCVCIVADTGGLKEVVPADGRRAASPRATPARSAPCSSACSPTRPPARRRSPRPASTSCGSTGLRWLGGPPRSANRSTATRTSRPGSELAKRRGLIRGT